VSVRGVRFGVSHVFTSVVVCILVVVVSLLFYVFSSGFVVRMPSSRSVSDVGKMYVVGYRSGPGYLVYYVVTRGPIVVRDVVIEYLNGSIACVEVFPGGLRLEPGTVNTIPIIGTLLHCERPIPDVGYVLFTSSSSVLAMSSPVKLRPIKHGLEELRFAYFEDEVARSSNRLYVNLSSDYWDSILVYPFAKIYAVRCQGNKCGSIWTKTTTVLPIGQNVLDIADMTLEQRYNLGPIVVVINPTYATENWTFKIIDALGGVHTFTLKKLVDSRTKVVIDMLLLWEDTWHPGVLKEIQEGLYNPDYVIDNWLDSIIRITIFVNDTIRIHVLSEGGAWMHAFFLEPPEPSSIENFLEKEIPNDVLKAISAIESGTGYVSPLGLKYIKPYYNDIHQIYWVPTGKLIDLSNVAWLCNMRTGRCIEESS